MPVRSRGLLLIGVIWFLLGLGMAFTTPVPVSDAWDTYLPESLRVALWWSAALGAIGAAIDKQDGKRDWLALAFCVVPPMIRITSFLWAWVVYLWPGGNPGYDRGWYSAAVYSALVGLVWLVASIPDLPPSGKIPDTGTGVGATESEDQGSD